MDFQVCQPQKNRVLCHLNMPGLSMYEELISRPVSATKTGQAPSRQYRGTLRIWNILAVYLESSSCVADPSLTSEG